MKSYMTTKELQESLSVSKGTIDGWRKRGLKYSKIGNKVLFKNEDVIHFIDSFKTCDYER